MAAVYGYREISGEAANGYGYDSGAGTIREIERGVGFFILEGRMKKEAEKDGETRTHLVIRRRVKNLLKAKAALAGISLEQYIERMLTQSPTGGKQ